MVCITVAVVNMATTINIWNFHFTSPVLNYLSHPNSVFITCMYIVCMKQVIFSKLYLYKNADDGKYTILQVIIDLTEITRNCLY